MIRSLHMKIVMIMVLIILSLMTVVGAFLINSVVAFYLNDFYSQISTVVSDQDLYRDLTQETAAERSGEVSGVEMLEQVLGAYAGELGVNGSNRNYYILDETGAYLAGTDDEYGPRLEYTENLLAVIRDRSVVGDESNVAADYMDVAIPIDRGDGQYIIYIRDNRDTVDELNDQLFILIMQALVFGLVISVLLSLVLSKTMVTPIQRLTDGAERVAGGDFSDKLEVTSRDEIGVLTNTFNDMAQQLRDTIQQVENERNKLDTLFLHMTDGVVAFSSEGLVIHANPAASDMLGISINDTTCYRDLFGDIAALDSVLSAPDYLEGERVQGERYLELPSAVSFREVPGLAMRYGGIGGFAHLDRDPGSALSVLEKIDPYMSYVMANVTNQADPAEYVKRFPFLSIYTNSDAFSLDEISQTSKNNILEASFSNSETFIRFLRELPI